MSVLMPEVRHSIVYRKEGMYCGWPANHGAWQWGDEFLVGFIVGEYSTEARMHNIKGNLHKVQARSTDGGKTWKFETPNVSFSGVNPTRAPRFDIDKVILRVCGNYDHGGEDCSREGAFYLSDTNGHVWHGPYTFTGIELPDTLHLTARTRVVGDLIFLSAATIRHWGSDYTFVVRHDGERFRAHGVVCDDQYRAVCPAVAWGAAQNGARLVCVMRRRGVSRRGGWIDASGSDDGGLTWRKLAHVGETGLHNGNPPALIEHAGKLYCAYANRSECEINVVKSSDGGESWYGHVRLDHGTCTDIGYPQLFKRSDGQLVCVYYWAADDSEQQFIKAATFAP